MFLQQEHWITHAFPQIPRLTHLSLTCLTCMLDAWLTWTLRSCLNYTSFCFQIFLKTELRCSPTSGHILSAGHKLFEKDSLCSNFPHEPRRTQRRARHRAHLVPYRAYGLLCPHHSPRGPWSLPCSLTSMCTHQDSLQLIQSPPQSSDPSVPDLRAQYRFPFSTSLPSHLIELTVRHSPN